MDSRFSSPFPTLPLRRLVDSLYDGVDCSVAVFAYFAIVRETRVL